MKCNYAYEYKRMRGPKPLCHTQSYICGHTIFYYRHYWLIVLDLWKRTVHGEEHGTKTITKTSACLGCAAVGVQAGLLSWYHHTLVGMWTWLAWRARSCLNSSRLQTVASPPFQATCKHWHSQIGENTRMDSSRGSTVPVHLNGDSLFRAAIAPDIGKVISQYT